MTWSFPVGRMFGSEIRIHLTFFILLLWIGVAAYAAAGAAAALVNIAFILALFACVVAHEFGHALAARRYGIATPDITLLPIGGMARLDHMPEKPSQEIVVALAGPAVNVVIWAVLVLILGVTTDLDHLAAIENPAANFWGRLAAVNLFLVLFNLIPAFPMDGGRVLRALLSFRFGRVRATQLAARTGQALAFVFGFLGLSSGNPILVLIAFFVFMAATAESADVAMRDLAHNLPARAAMITLFDTLHPDDSLRDAAERLLRTTQHEFPVLTEDGTLAGFLTRQAIFSGMSGDRPGLPVSEAMTRDVPMLPLTAPLEKALDALYRGSAPAVALSGLDGRMIGYITRENIGEFMVVSGRRR